MTFTTRLCVFAALALAGMVAWYWNTTLDQARDITELAVQQFQNSDAVPTQLQQASLAQNYWPLVWPALLAATALVMFWDDIERWRKRNQATT